MSRKPTAVSVGSTDSGERVVVVCDDGSAMDAQDRRRQGLDAPARYSGYASGGRSR